MENWTIATIWERLSGQKAPKVKDTHVEYTNANGTHVEYEREGGKKKDEEKSNERGRTESKNTEAPKLKVAFLSQKPDKKKLAQQTRKSMTPEEMKAATRYTGEKHESINEFLRNGVKNPTAERDAKLIKSGINKTVLDEPLIVHRKCSDDYIKLIFGISEINKDKLLGKEATDKGIISTSLKQNPNGISGRNSIYFNLPKGYHAAYIAKISEYKNQEEVILLSQNSFKPAEIKENDRDGLNFIVNL